MHVCLTSVFLFASLFLDLYSCGLFGSTASRCVLHTCPVTLTTCLMLPVNLGELGASMSVVGYPFFDFCSDLV